MKRHRIIKSYFFLKTCYHGNDIAHSVAPKKSKAIVLLKERVGEIFSNSYIYSLRHRKCGVRGFIHELFVSKLERARYERVRAFDTNNE